MVITHGMVNGLLKRPILQPLDIIHIKVLIGRNMVLENKKNIFTVILIVFILIIAVAAVYGSYGKKQTANILYGQWYSQNHNIEFSRNVPTCVINGNTYKYTVKNKHPDNITVSFAPTEDIGYTYEATIYSTENNSYNLALYKVYPEHGRILIDIFAKEAVPPTLGAKQILFFDFRNMD